MPGIYRSGHYLDNLSNHWLMKRWRSSKIAWIPQSWLGPQFLGTRPAPGRQWWPSLTPRDGGAYDPLLGTNT